MIPNSVHVLRETIHGMPERSEQERQTIQTIAVDSIRISMWFQMRYWSRRWMC